MIKVFVVDDHRLFLSGVRAELEGRDGITLSGTAQDVDEAIEALRGDPPDVALVGRPHAGRRGTCRWWRTSGRPIPM